MLRGRERPLEELGGDDVREARLCSLARDHPVAPRAFVISGLVEVQREEGRLLVRLVTCALLENLADAAVDLAAPSEREPS